MKQTIKVGLTGIMGAGKSSVIAHLNTLGIAVLNCDEINRKLIAKGAEGYQKIIQAFGNTILDGAGNLDAKKMSDVIFTNEERRLTLEGIIHPLIKERIITYCKTCDDDIVVVEVPLLFEVHWETFFDETWVVTCAQDILLQRLKQYRHIEESEAKRRLALQIPQEEKCAKADVVLYNDTELLDLQKQIDREVARLREEALRVEQRRSSEN